MEDKFSFHILINIPAIRILSSSLLSNNARYHSVQNLSSSRVLSEHLTIKIYRAVILPLVLFGCENWSLTLREERRLRVFEIGC
jgi:hypothetical protein